MAVCDAGTHAPTLIPGPWSRKKVAQWIIDHAKTAKRTLIGIDCNFGYAQSIGEQQFGPNYTYLDLWNAVEAANQNEPNFFAGGYWQHPHHQKYFWTQGTMPKDFAMPKRLTETVCGECGYGWPESPFKLIGAKQVGKGGLAGMRMAHYLRKHLGYRLSMWPFEDNIDQAHIVMTEIYPRQFLKRIGHGNEKIRTVSDLNTALIKLDSKPAQNSMDVSDHDTDALVSAAGLRKLCGPDSLVPENIAWPSMLDQMRARTEGWIFGVGDI